jgi:hypothetical protein
LEIRNTETSLFSSAKHVNVSPFLLYKAFLDILHANIYISSLVIYVKEYLRLGDDDGGGGRYA